MVTETLMTENSGINLKGVGKFDRLGEMVGVGGLGASGSFVTDNLRCLSLPGSH